MLRWRDEHANGPARLARLESGTAATRPGAEAAGLETAGQRRCPRRDTRRRHPAPGRQPRLTAGQLARLLALAVALRRAKERLRHKRTVIRTCISQTGYGEGKRHSTFGEDQ
ncbi:MAG: hypothetical protein ACXWQ5_17155 [Ktedonobacterales bacterium]